MSTTILEVSFENASGPIDPDAVVLSNEEGTFGARRLDTGAIVVAAATAMTRISAGIYRYSFTDPAPGLTYNYWVAYTIAGLTSYIEKEQSGAAPATDLPSYQTVAQARQRAASMPASQRTKIDAATDAELLAALAAATSDIDSAMRYQGRKYDPEQTLEFPRYTGSGWPSGYEMPGGVTVGQQCGPDGSIWDWDSTNNVAVVPEKVLMAVVHQAESVLAGDREQRLADRHDGVKSQGMGSMSETYDGEERPLCRRAWRLMLHYRLKGGEFV